MSKAEILKISKVIRESNVLEDSIEILKAIRPHWISERDKNGVEIKSKVFTEGISNKLMGFNLSTEPKDIVLIKMYGVNTDLLIDRQAEIETMMLLHENKCGPQLYALFDNGICYEFVHGMKFTKEMCPDPKIYPLVAKEMATIHRRIPVKPDDKNGKETKSAMWDKMWKFMKLCEEVLGENETLAKNLCEKYGIIAGLLRTNLTETQSLLERQGMPIALCHNDLQIGNIIYNEEESKVSFIDFEYAMPNYIAFDVANHFNEFGGVENPDYSLCPDRAFRSKWNSEYLKHYGTPGFTQEQFEDWVDICIPASRLFWILWAIVQAQLSKIEFDYANYAGITYAEFTKSMEVARERGNVKHS